MDKLRLYFLKALKKLKIIKYLNFHLSKTINGTRIKIPSIYGMGLSNYVTEPDWLDSLIEQFTSAESGVFVDVGTNIGQTVMKVKSLKPRIKFIGFEPNPSCVFYIRELILCNNFKDCTIFNCALFSSVQFLNLEKSLTDDLRASVISSLRPGYFKESETVIAIEYDSFFLDKDISFVKIDAEGSELEVIGGMKQSIQKYKPLIVCEVLDSHNSSTQEFTQSRATELSKLIQSLNYSIFQLTKDQITHHLVDMKKINEITTRQWTQQSKEMNDYLFYPSSKEEEIITELKRIINNKKSQHHSDEL